MLRYFVFIIVSVFLFSCAAKKVEKPVVEKPVVEKPVVEKPVVEKPVVEKPVITEKRSIVWLEDLLEENTLTQEEQAFNQSIIDQFGKQKELIAKIQKVDIIEKQVLETKKAQLEAEKKEFQALLKEKGLSQDVQDQIANAQSLEEVEKILKAAGLSDAEIVEILAAKKKLLEKDKDLRIDALDKIYARLVRNRELGVEDIFCVRAGSIDTFVLSAIFYDTNKYVIKKNPSDKLFLEVDLISESLTKYADLMLQIDGNTDERGTNIYNKSLGDFRWTSALDLLEIIGFEKDLRGVSRGEECPLERGNESIANWWSKNRRADFVWKLKET